MNPKNIPQNKDILQTLDTAKNVLEEGKDIENLNPKGEQILTKAQDVISGATQVVKKVNPNDRLQTIMKETQKMYDEIYKSNNEWNEITSGITKINSQDLKKLLNKFKENVRSLLLELVRSNDFRQDLYDLFYLFYNFILESEPVQHTKQKVTELAEDAKESLGIEEKEDKNKRQKSSSYEKFNTSYTKDELLEKFTQVLQRISNKARGKEMIDNLFDIFYFFKHFIPQKTNETKEIIENIQSNEHFQKIVNLSLEMFTAITNYNAQKIITDIKGIFSLISKDQEILKLLKDMSDFVKNILSNPKELNSNDFKRKLEELYERGKKLKRDKELINYSNNLKEEIENLMNQMDTNNGSVVTLKNDIQDLVSLLILDDKGNITFKPEIFEQLKIILLSTLLQKLKYPIPEIKYSGESICFRLKGIMLALQDIIPEKIIAKQAGTIELESNNKNNNNKAVLPELTKAKEKLTIQLQNINIKVTSAEIEFSRDNFPTIDDRGIIDITIGKDGGLDLTISLLISNNLNSSDKIFELDTVDCVLNDLQVKLRDTKHDFLYNTLLTVFNPLLKSTVENVMEENIARVLLDLNTEILSTKKFVKETVKNLGQQMEQGMKRKREEEQKPQK